MAKLAFSLLLITLSLNFLPQSWAGSVTTNKARERFKQRCEDGSGKACFDFAMSLWSPKGPEAEQREALSFAHRACALKYEAACDWSHQHSTHTVRIHKGDGKEPTSGEGVGDICFSIPQFSTARLTPFEMPAGVPHGQRIDKIKPNSFWERAGLKEGDVIYKVNNMAFNNSKDAMSAFSSSGTKFGFEVIRAEETITLWYSCR